MKAKKTLDLVKLATAALAIVATVGLVASCGEGSEGTDSSTSAATEEPAAEEAARAATEQKKTATIQAAEQRLSQSRQQVSDLDGRAQTVGIDPESDLAGQLVELKGQVSNADRSLGQLKSATLDSWESSSSKLNQELNAIQGAQGSVESQVAQLEQELEERQQEMLAMKETVGELAEGLIAGLDGDVYLAYSRATVESVKSALSDLGLYRGTIDGELDNDAMLALARFQELNLLAVNGVPSPATRALLSAE